MAQGVVVTQLLQLTFATRGVSICTELINGNLARGFLEMKPGEDAERHPGGTVD